MTGSQTWPYPEDVFQALDGIACQSKGRMVLVHGACKVGADAHAAAWARDRISRGFAITVEPHPADWNGPKKKGAGYARNAEMVKLGADRCLAFIHDNSPGSIHTAGLAEAAGIPTKIYRSNSVGINDSNVTLEDVRIVFRNFAGAEGQYNRKGDRNFAVVLDEETADKLEKGGWNVKRKPPREEGDDDFIYLPVAVSFTGRPPRLVLISSQGRTTLDEAYCELLDYADMETVDMIIRPYHWNVNGKTGVKAYLHAIYVTIVEDYLERKYMGIPEIGSQPQLAIEEGYLEGEVISDSEDI